MTHRYSEIYLDDAMSILGEAVEYAVLACKVPGQEFLNCFIKSGIAKLFEEGHPKYVTGMSGIELAQHVFRHFGMEDDIPQRPSLDYPPEYWVGWTYAYYQWHSGLPFREIVAAIPYQELLERYWPLHEADVTKAAAVMDDIMAKRTAP